MRKFTAEEESETLSDGTKVCVLKIGGFVQLDTVKEMEKQIMARYDTGVRLLLLDLAEIQLINSTGLGLLVKLQDTFKADNGEIFLTGLQEKIGGLLDMLGISSLFRNIKNKEELVIALKKGGAAVSTAGKPSTEVHPTPVPKSSPASAKPAVEPPVAPIAAVQTATASAPPTKKTTLPAEPLSPPEKKSETHSQKSTPPSAPLLSPEKKSETHPHTRTEQEKTVAMPQRPAVVSPSAKVAGDTHPEPVPSEKKSETHSRTDHEKTVVVPMAQRGSAAGQTSKPGNEVIPQPTSSTRRFKKNQIKYKVSLKYNSQMDYLQQYPLDMSASMEGDELALASATLEESQILIIPVVPGCLVTPPQRQLHLGEKIGDAHFTITPLMAGKQPGVIELWGAQNKLQTIKFSVATVRNYGKIVGCLTAALAILLGIILDTYQLAPQAGRYNPLGYLFGITKGILYPSLVVAGVSLAMAFIFSRKGKPQLESCEAWISF